MRYLRLLGQIVSTLIETVRVEKTLTEITEAQAHIESLVAYAVEGYTITIHCQERKYACTYSRWYIPDFIVKTYEVFATIAGKAPQVLIDVCSRDSTFPGLLHPWSSTASQKQAAIEAFLDLIQARLRAATSPA